MKIIHIPYCFYPDPIGGTEVYVEALSKELQKKDVKVVIAAPAKQTAHYTHNGIPVRRFAMSSKIDGLREFYGEGDPKAAIEFKKILDEEKPDLVHIHAFTYGISLQLVREIKKSKIAIVFTYHTPTVSCPRGTLMRWGKKVCDGELNLRICASCVLQGSGLPKGIAGIIGLLPTSLSSFVGNINFSGGLWTALRMRELLNIRFMAFYAFMKEVDHIIVLCQWCKELLLRNNIPPDKVTLLKHGLDQKLVCNQQNSQLLRLEKNPLKLVYAGRLDPTKGVDIVIRALKLMPKADMEFDIYGIIQDNKGTGYFKKLKKMASSDPRINFMPLFSNKHIISVLKNYHLLVVPSMWFETGPLVVLEAFSAGIPVIGSSLGGIAELIEDGVNGLLVQPGSVRAWYNQLQKIYKERSILERLRSNIQPPPTMDTVARQVLEISKKMITISMQKC